MTGGYGSAEAATAAIALDPAETLIAAIALALGLTVLALLRTPCAAAPQERAQACPGRVEVSLERRRAERSRATGASMQHTAVLEARIRRHGRRGPGRGLQADRESGEAVARIMRAGLRGTDEVLTIPGDGFVVVLDNAREDEAAGIARRLHRALTGARIPGLGGRTKLSARFGVAEQRAGESVDAARARASGALDAGAADGEDCVVTASAIEEILFLPPPAEPRTGAQSKAA